MVSWSGDECGVLVASRAGNIEAVHAIINKVPRAVKATDKVRFYVYDFSQSVSLLIQLRHFRDIFRDQTYLGTRHIIGTRHLTTKELQIFLL